MKTSVVPPMLLFHLVMVGVSTANFLSNDRCPLFWWFYEAENICIKLYFQRQSFNESQEICKEELADLVSIQNEEKNTFIGDLMKQANTWSSWIGVYHQSGETYVLASGSELPYENWEPNGVQKGPDKCVELQVDMSNDLFTDKSWDTSECRSVNHFTCEKRADKAGERSQGLHIGVWDASRNGTYMNPGGTPQIYFYPWAEGFPLNPRRRQYCLDMDSNGLWRNLGCGSRRSFICEKDLHQEDFSSRCPDDWTPSPIDETCLRFNETITSWWSARRECQRQDGDLVQVFDQSKAHQVHG